jgi:hypothetical protein
MTFDADLGFSDRSLAARHGNLDGAVAPVSAGKVTVKSGSRTPAGWDLEVWPPGTRVSDLAKMPTVVTRSVVSR